MREQLRPVLILLDKLKGAKLSRKSPGQIKEEMYKLKNKHNIVTKDDEHQRDLMLEGK